MREKKKELLYWAQRTEEAGLCVPKGGNFSLRDRESGLILMTPSGLDRPNALPEEMSVLTLDGKWMDGNKPTSEYQMHLAVYQDRADVGAIAHTHSRFATVLAVWEKPIPPIVYEVLMLGGEVPIAPYGRPGTDDLAEAVRLTLKESDVCLLAKHGVLAAGADCGDAFLKALYIEETASIYYHALLLGQGVEPPRLSMEEVKAWKYPELEKQKES
jgi:L-ribulose-5-phosphate 4-epimerase